MDETKENTKEQETKIKTRPGSGFLKQLYSSARTTAENTHSNFKNLTTFLVNFVQVEKIDASELQVRTHFDDEEIKTLANSIKEHGVLQPILVVQNGDRYKVIAGERRLRATKLAGLERIPARVLSTDDKATHEIALRENLDRVDLHPIEEGEGYLSLLENQTYTSYESIAKAFGKPKSRITECIGFTRLPDDTKLELMQRNIKNRSLLRQLLQIPPADHKKIIEEASQKEEVLLINENNVSVDTKSNEKEKLTVAEKKEPKPFAFHFDGKKLVVPSFVWKVGEGPERLKEYLQALAKIQEQTRDLS